MQATCASWVLIQLASEYLKGRSFLPSSSDFKLGYRYIYIYVVSVQSLKSSPRHLLKAPLFICSGVAFPVPPRPGHRLCPAVLKSPSHLTNRRTASETEERGGDRGWFWITFFGQVDKVWVDRQFPQKGQFPGTKWHMIYVLCFPPPNFETCPTAIPSPCSDIFRASDQPPPAPVHPLA